MYTKYLAPRQCYLQALFLPTAALTLKRKYLTPRQCYLKTLFLPKVDLSQCESRLLRIARGSGTHPDQVRGLLKLHKHFEKVFGKVGKNMKGDVSKAKQLQVRGAMRVTPRLSVHGVSTRQGPFRGDCTGGG